MTPTRLAEGHALAPRRRPLLARLLMPALALAVAGGLLIWGDRREAQRTEAFDRLGRDVCAMLREGRDPAPSLHLSSELMRAPLAAALAGMGDAARDGSTCAARVEAGPGPGAPQSAATHHVTLAIGGRDRLGLRVGFDFSEGAPVVAGFWVPEDAAAIAAP